MNIFKRTMGHIIYGFAKVISILFDAFITIIEFIVTLVSNLARGFLALIGMGGCLLLFMFLGPFGIFLLLHPVVLLSILFFVIFPILGTKFVSYLKYRRYMITEYLFDLANYLIEGKGRTFQSFNEYGNKYRRMEEEKRREEWRKRQEEQQKQWEERFKQWYEYQNRQGGAYGGHSGTWWYGNQTGYGNGKTYMDPAIEFKSKYEKSCDLLGVPYDADKYQIKLAYRKKAKEYHPDLNKAPDATEKFQKINDAYEFLSDANIERYKTLR